MVFAVDPAAVRQFALFALVKMAISAIEASAA